MEFVCHTTSILSFVGGMVSIFDPSFQFGCFNLRFARCKNRRSDGAFLFFAFLGLHRNDQFDSIASSTRFSYACLSSRDGADFFEADFARRKQAAYAFCHVPRGNKCGAVRGITFKRNDECATNSTDGYRSGQFVFMGLSTRTHACPVDTVCNRHDPYDSHIFKDAAFFVRRLYLYFYCGNVSILPFLLAPLRNAAG